MLFPPFATYYLLPFLIEDLISTKPFTDNNVILVKGNVPGPKKGFVEIKSSIKKGNK
jgi:large subunit ribosomal protein L3